MTKQTVVPAKKPKNVENAKRKAVLRRKRRIHLTMKRDRVKTRTKMVMMVVMMMIMLMMMVVMMIDKMKRMPKKTRWRPQHPKERRLLQKSLL